MSDFSNNSGSGTGPEVRASPLMAALKVNPAMRTFAAGLAVRGQHHEREHSRFAPSPQ